jgi:hypothetical protein
MERYVTAAVERSEKDPKQLPILKISRIATPVLDIRLSTGNVWEAQLRGLHAK